jgi:hypothetical protein
MAAEAPLLRLAAILSREAGWSKAHVESAVLRNLQLSQEDLLSHVRAVGREGKLELLVATEKAIVRNELKHYANSKGMEASLNTALLELEAIKRHLGLVADKVRYAPINDAYSFPRNREKGLPLDEARQAFKSHRTRLGNMDKVRLPDREKAVVEARLSNLGLAQKLYAERQAKALGVELPPSL